MKIPLLYVIVCIIFIVVKNYIGIAEMSFTSIQYLLIFLPLVSILNYVLFKFNKSAAKVTITIISILFYYQLDNDGAYWLLASCVTTYSSFLLFRNDFLGRAAIALGISLNVIMLGTFKYNYFFVENGLSFSNEKLIAPVAISFFVFQQISFLVDSYKNKINDVNLIDYIYYVTFFPKMIAGPITRYSKLLSESELPVNSGKVISGMILISFGFFKKVILSSIFAQSANIGFSSNEPLMLMESWVTSLSYTMQIYYDFSGYSDIAIGSALLLGVSLPANFNSPYKAENIRDFWSRWHISLSTWLRDYVYIPLGGSRNGYPITVCNIMITFLISGAWHGATINFVMWGALHGIATVINMTWSRLGYSMNRIAGIIVTFLFINLSWVPFRAESFEQVISIYKGMIGLNGVSTEFANNVSLSLNGSYFDIYNNLTDWGVFLPTTIFAIIASSFFIFLSRNSNQISCYESSDFSIGKINVISCAIILSLSVIFMFGGSGAVSFIYSNF